MEKSPEELCLQERLLLETQLHLLACEEVALTKDRQQHQEDYRKQEVAEVLLVFCIQHKTLAQISARCLALKFVLCRTCQIRVDP